VEPQGLVVDETRVRLERLPRAFDGFTIGQLSDLHVGPIVPAAQVARAAEMLMACKPDLVALTGDFVSQSAQHARSCAEALSQLRAPFGVFAVLGNHDYWTLDAAAIVRELTRVGVRVLQNENVPMERGDARWDLIGVDDVWEKHADLERALALTPREVCRIALVHEPDFAEEAAKYAVDLQLSGHSHGGQVRLPFLGALILPWLGRKYPIGLQRAGSFTQVYTTRGVGLVSPEVRFNCPPEVTVIRLEGGG
jgi:predicted MPP superfamily phosphohydrolase